MSTTTIRVATTLPQAVESAVTALRAGDATLPVRIVVPSHLMGLALARQVFGDTGHINLRFVLAEELAWRVVSDRALADGWSRIDDETRRALVLEAAGQAVQAPDLPPYLQQAVSSHGFAAAATRTLTDLALTSLEPDALTAVAGEAPDPARLRLLADLWRRYAERTANARLLDTAGLFRRAANALPCPGLGPVVLCEDLDLPAAPRTFFEALAAHHPLAAALGRHSLATPRARARVQAFMARLDAQTTAADSRQAQSSLGRLQQRLFAGHAPAPAADSPLDPSLRIVSAPGVDPEATEIARLIQRAVDQGLTFDQIGVVLRDPARYVGHLAAAFERAGVDAYFVEGVPRVDPAARALGLLLDLLGLDLERAPLMELFTTAQINWSAVLGDDAEVSPARWDRLSARAGIVSGLASWRARLAAAREQALERGEFGARDAALCASLLTAVQQLNEDLARFPAAGSWNDFLQATLALLRRWIRRSQLVQDRLQRALSPLAQHAAPPGRERFLRTMRELIASQTYREGKLGERRVFVGSIGAARGMRFTLAFIPGLVERQFPGVVRPDPLLLDQERALLSPELPVTRDAQERERQLFINAVHMASERLVLSYSRADGQTGREQVPSSFLLAAAEAATGRRISPDALSRLARPSATMLGRPFPGRPKQAIDLLERDLSLVASAVPGAAAHVPAASRTVRRVLARSSARPLSLLTEYDGAIDPVAAAAVIQRLRLNGRTTSASGVQQLARCPYAAFLARGLGLRAWEEPAHAFELDQTSRGSVYHHVVHALFAELKPAGQLPLTDQGLPAARKRAHELLAAELQQLVRDGAVIDARLLDPAAHQLRADLGGLLQREVAERGEWVPARFELAFADLEQWFDAQRCVRFTGFIDRIDFAADPPRARVVDYKTGTYKRHKDARFDGGKELQLQIYNLAATRELPGRQVEAADYYYATEQAGFVRRTCEADEETEATLRRVLCTLDDLAAAGLMCPTAEACKICDFTALCGADIERRVLHKQNDQRLAAFRGLREIP